MRQRGGRSSFTCVRHTGRVTAPGRFGGAYDVGFAHGYTLSEGGHGRSEGYDPSEYFRGFAVGFLLRQSEI
jgi:hypothetical protein